MTPEEIRRRQFIAGAAALGVAGSLSVTSSAATRRSDLIRKEIERGCYLYEVAGEKQVAQVVARFGLAARARPLSRCLACNGLLRSVEKGAVAHRVPQQSREVHERFFECAACAQVYWEGSHVRRMRERIARMLG